MGISLGQSLSLSALSVRFLSDLSPLFKLFGGALPHQSKTGISRLSSGLLAVFLSSCASSGITRFSVFLLQQDP